MAGRYNPNGPDVAGSEWYGSRALQTAVSRTLGRGPIVASSATETIDNIYMAMWGMSGQQDFLTCDVYDLADPIQDPEEVILCRPGANFGPPNEAGWFKRDGGTVTDYDANAYTKIREIVGTAHAINSGSDSQLVYIGIKIAPSGSARVMFTGDNAQFYNAQTGASGEDPTGMRVGAMEVTAIVANQSAGALTFDGFLNIDDVPYASMSGPVILKSGQELKRVTFSWPWNPSTGLPWVRGERADLTGGPDGFGVGLISKNQFGFFIVTTVTLQMRLFPERRIVTAQTFGPPIGTGRIIRFDIVSTADRSSTTWAKLNNHDYLLLVSAPRGLEGVSLVGVDTALVKDHETDVLQGATSAQVTLGPGAVPTVEATNPTTLATHTLLVLSGAAKPDSNAYADAVEARCGDDGTATFQQRLSSESAQAYGGARLIVGVDSDGQGGVAQDAPLVFRLRRASDNVVLAGPVNIEPDDVRADGKYHTVDVRFSPVALTAALPVLLEVTSASTKGWRIPVLYTFPRTISSSDSVAVIGAAQSIGGTADMANGTNTTDMPWSIVLAPPDPTGLASSAGTVANRPALQHNPSSGNSPSVVPYAHLSWTATTVGTGFAYNEIQRQYLGVYYTIARITAEAAHNFYDREGRLGIAGDTHPRSYRMRTVRVEGGYSNWVSFPAVTVNVADCGDIVLASNHSDEDALSVKDLGGSHAWEQQQTDRSKVVPILGDDYPMAFYPSSTPAERFTRKLAIAYGDAAVAIGGAVTPDRTVFDPILALLQDRTLPYISYADAWGRVWFTSPAVVSPGPTHDAEGSQYWVNVTFTEVSGPPVPVVTASPWVP